MPDFHSGFQDVDAAESNEFLFRFLDAANENPSILAYRRRMDELCPVETGWHILDVGCGLGHEVLRLARQVAPEGDVVGVDTSERFILEARHRFETLGLPVSFETGDVRSLPFADQAFDLVRAERVLLYVEDLECSVGEIARVLRPGGQAVLFDFDYNAFFIDSNHDRITRRIEELLSDDPRNPLIGRQIPALLRHAWLTVEVVEPFTIEPSLIMVEQIYSAAIERGIADGSYSRDEIDEWWTDQRALEASGMFYHANPGYIVVARKT